MGCHFHNLYRQLYNLTKSIVIQLDVHIRRILIHDLKLDIMSSKSNMKSIEIITYFDGAVENISSNSAGCKVPSWKTRMTYIKLIYMY